MKIHSTLGLKISYDLISAFFPVIINGWFTKHGSITRAINKFPVYAAEAREHS